MRDSSFNATSFSPLYASFVIAAVLAFVQSGCANTFGTPTPSPGPSTDGSKSAANQPPPIGLSHDFGVVAPSTIQTHRFFIPNNSAIPWTPKSIETSCGCTVATLSGATFPPGDANYADLAYSAGFSSLDDAKTVVISFSEPEAPRVSLNITISIRKPMTIDPIELALGDLGKISQQPRTVEIANWSGKPWKRLRVLSDADWLRPETPTVTHVEERTVVPTERPDKPIEVWHVASSVVRHDLPYGPAQARLIFTAEDTELREVVLVSGSRFPPVQVFPRGLFLETQKPGSKVERVIRVTFAGECRSAPQEIPLSTNPPGLLTASWVMKPGNFRQINITVKAPDQVGVFTGDVSFRSPCTAELISIPIQGIVGEASPP